MATMDIAVEKLLLYFYLSLLDDSRAEAATLKGLRLLTKSIQKNKTANLNEVFPLVIKATQQVLKDSKASRDVSSPGLVQGRIEFPAGSDWGGWFAFRREAELKEFEAVLWTRILNIPEECVSQGLDISMGTLHHRVGRGLKVLGRIISKASANA
jgi:hypothetical protein